MSSQDAGTAKRRAGRGRHRSTAREQTVDGETALLEAYRRHGSAVYSLACHLLGAEEAESVTVAAFLALWRARTPPPSGSTSLRASLLAHAHRHAVQLVRSDLDRPSRLATTTPTGAARDAPGRAGSPAHAVLSNLPADERLALFLAYFEGRSYPEIARLVGQPGDTVKAQLREGVEHLRRQWSSSARGRGKGQVRLESPE